MMPPKYTLYTKKPSEKIYFEDRSFMIKKKERFFPLPFLIFFFFLLGLGFFFFTHAFFISSQIYRLENELLQLIKENKGLTIKLAEENNLEKIKNKLDKEGFIIPPKVEYIKLYQK